MGYEAFAQLVVGIHFETDEMDMSREVPGCEHKHEFKFCPQCGAPATKVEPWSVEDELLEKGDEDHIFRETSEGPVHVIGVEIGNGRPVTLVKPATKTRPAKFRTEHGTAIPLEDVDRVIEAAKAELQKVLEPFGLWDESRVALHTIRYDSY